MTLVVGPKTILGMTKKPAPVNALSPLVLAEVPLIAVHHQIIVLMKDIQDMPRCSHFNKTGKSPPTDVRVVLPPKMEPAQSHYWPICRDHTLESVLVDYR